MAKVLYPLSGVVAIAQAPFDEADRIDLDRFARGIADRLAAGVEGPVRPPDVPRDGIHRRIADGLIEKTIRLHATIGRRLA